MPRILYPSTWYQESRDHFGFRQMNFKPSRKRATLCGVPTIGACVVHANASCRSMMKSRSWKLNGFAL